MTRADWVQAKEESKHKWVVMKETPEQELRRKLREIDRDNWWPGKSAAYERGNFFRRSRRY